MDDAVETRSTIAAVGLCLNPPIVWSMTIEQRDIFQQLCALQIEEAGPHSLLPNVMQAFVALARQPWWDAGTAGIPYEDAPESRNNRGPA